MRESLDGCANSGQLVLDQLGERFHPVLQDGVAAFPGGLLGVNGKLVTVAKKGLDDPQVVVSHGV
jgi:hypothetical protein